MDIHLFSYLFFDDDKCEIDCKIYGIQSRLFSVFHSWISSFAVAGATLGVAIAVQILV